MNYEIKGQWNASEDGWVYETRAVTKTGRIIARAKAHLAYDNAVSLEDIHGADGKAEIERLAAELCESLVPSDER